MLKKFLVLILLIFVNSTFAASYTQMRIINLEQELSQLREVVLNQTIKISEQQREIQNLQGEIELLSYQFELLKNSQAEKLLILEKRLSQQQPVPPITSPVKSTIISEPVVPLVDKEINSVPVVQDKTITYQSIVEAIQTGDYEKVIIISKQFLKLYPQNNQVDEVQYWLGQAYYDLKQLNSALTAFSTLLEKYPYSSRNAEALLNIGYIYYDKKDYATAQAIFQQIKENYPNTGIAQLAEQKLQEIREKNY
jgi:tol-pal system protein YbgF